MLQKDLVNILNVLKKMEEHELVVAELYRKCSQIFKVDKEFWADMEQTEIKHTQNINTKIKEWVL